MAMIAIGIRGPKENLPPKLQEMESPSDRRPFEEIVMEGHFKQEKNQKIYETNFHKIRSIRALVSIENAQGSDAERDYKLSRLQFLRLLGVGVIGYFARIVPDSLT